MISYDVTRLLDNKDNEHLGTTTYSVPIFAVRRYTLTFCFLPLAAKKSYVYSEDFTFALSGLEPDKLVDGRQLRRVSLAQLPALEGQGISMTLVNVEPCAINLPHIHPRAPDVSKNAKMLTSFPLWAPMNRCIRIGQNHTKTNNYRIGKQKKQVSPFIVLKRTQGSGFSCFPQPALAAKKTCCSHTALDCRHESSLHRARITTKLGGCLLH